MKNEMVLLEMKKAMRLKGYSPKTCEAYQRHIGHLEGYYGKELDTFTEEVNDYLLCLLDDEECSASYVNQAISAIKLLYGVVLRKSIIVNGVFRPKKERKYPDILSHEEVKKILNSVKNLKHKAILVVVYSAGL